MLKRYLPALGLALATGLHSRAHAHASRSHHPAHSTAHRGSYHSERGTPTVFWLHSLVPQQQPSTQPGRLLRPRPALCTPAAHAPRASEPEPASEPEKRALLLRALARCLSLVALARMFASSRPARTLAPVSSSRPKFLHRRRHAFRNA